MDLMSLDVQQLLEVKKQLETEVQHLTSSFGQLKAAQAKFKSCIESVATIKPENKDKTTLIPLTSSLYVPGKLADLENVIVDVGTGYFVEKSTADATKMYQEKVEFLTKNLEQLQETVLRQQENLQTTVEMIRMVSTHLAALSRLNFLEDDVLTVDTDLYVCVRSNRKQERSNRLQHQHQVEEQVKRRQHSTALAWHFLPSNTHCTTSSDISNLSFTDNMLDMTSCMFAITNVKLVMGP